MNTSELIANVLSNGSTTNEAKIDYLTDAVYFNYEFMHSKAKSEDLSFIGEVHPKIEMLCKAAEYDSLSVRSKAKALLNVSYLYRSLKTIIALYPDSILHEVTSRVSQEYADKLRHSNASFALIPIQNGFDAHLNEKPLILSHHANAIIMGHKWMQGTSFICMTVVVKEFAYVTVLNYESRSVLKNAAKVFWFSKYIFLRKIPHDDISDINELDGGIIHTSGFASRSIYLKSFANVNYTIKTNNLEKRTEMFLTSSKSLLIYYKNHFEIIDFSEYTAIRVCFTSEKYADQILVIKTTSLQDLKHEVYMPAFDSIEKTLLCVLFETKVKIFSFDKNKREIENGIELIEIAFNEKVGYSDSSFLLDRYFIDELILQENRVNYMNQCSKQIIRFFVIHGEYAKLESSNINDENVKMRIINVLRNEKNEIEYEIEDIKSNLQYLLSNRDRWAKIQIFDFMLNVLLFGDSGSEKYNSLFIYDSGLNVLIKKIVDQRICRQLFQNGSLCLGDKNVVIFYNNKNKNLCVYDVDAALTIDGNFENEITKIKFLDNKQLIIMLSNSTVKSIDLNKWLKTVSKTELEAQDFLFICPLLRNNKKHMLIEPMQLSCGPAVCNKCLRDYIEQNELFEDDKDAGLLIECPILNCSVKHPVKTFFKASSDFTKLFDKKSVAIFFDVVKKFNSTYDEISESVNSIFENRAFELLIRMESLAVTVDEIAENFLKQVEMFETKMLNSVKDSDFRKIERFRKGIHFKSNHAKFDKNNFGLIQNPLVVMHPNNELESTAKSIKLNLVEQIKSSFEGILGFVDEKHVLVAHNYTVSMVNVESLESVFTVISTTIVFNSKMIIKNDYYGIELYAIRHSNKIEIQKTSYLYKLDHYSKLKCQLNPNNEHQFLVSMFNASEKCFKIILNELNSENNEVTLIREVTLNLSELNFNESIYFSLYEIIYESLNRENELCSYSYDYKASESIRIEAEKKIFKTYQLNQNYCVTHTSNYFVYLSLASVDSGTQLSYQVNCANFPDTTLLLTASIETEKSRLDEKKFISISSLKNEDDFIVHSKTSFSYFKITDNKIQLQYALDGSVETISELNDRFIFIKQTKKNIIYDIATGTERSSACYGLTSNSKYMVKITNGKFDCKLLEVFQISDIEHVLYQFPLKCNTSDISRNIKSNEKYCCVLLADRLLTFMFP